MPLPTLDMKTLCPCPRGTGKDRRSGRFLMMVCDAAQRFLLAAEAALVSGRRPSATANILRAQSILVEMMGSVDRSVLPDLASAHARVCQHLIDSLSDALVTGDPARVRRVRSLLLGFQDAWADASDPFALEPVETRWRVHAAGGQSGIPPSRSNRLYSTSEYT